MSYEVKVAGIKLPALGYDWQIRAGVVAPIQGWIVPRYIADEVISKYLGKEIELTLDKITVKRVYVLGATAAYLDPIPAPDLRTLLFTDVRWYWTRGWLVRDVNVRRKTADTKFMGAEVPIDAQTPIYDVQYAPWSIAGKNQPYTYQMFMQAVMDYAAKVIPQDKGKIAWVLDKSRFLQGPGRTVEEVMLDDWIPSGLARAIAAFPGRTLIPDLNGQLHVSDAAFGAEIPMVQGLDPDHPVAGGGHMVVVDMSAMRPSKFVIRFTPEFEVKFWADENATGVAATRNPDDPYLIPVVKIPDKKLSVTTALPGQAAVTRNLAQGSIAPQRDVFKSWGVPTDGGRPVPPLSDDVVRKYFLGPTLEANYVLRSVPDPDPIWAARVRETKHSYRQLVQINPVFWDKVLSAVTKRASVIDQATGTRADSPVFAGCALRPKVRWFAAKVTKTGHNVRGLGTYTRGADDGISANDQQLGPNSKNQPAPCTVHLVDHEQGILFFEWKVPSDGLYSAIAPSEIENAPDLDPKSYAGQLNLATTWESQKLVARWKLATILSCIPAAPNSDERLFELEITLDAARDYLGVAPPGKTLGPPKVMRVSPNTLTARFAWSDDQNTRDRILKAFGVGQPSNPSVSASDPSLTVKSLSPVNLETEVRPLAKAKAGAELAALLDHYEGELRVPMTDKTKGVLPIGSVHTVTFRVTADKSLVILQASGDSPTVDVMSLLPNGARARILREVPLE